MTDCINRLRNQEKTMSILYKNEIPESPLSQSTSVNVSGCDQLNGLMSVFNLCGSY